MNACLFVILKTKILKAYQMHINLLKLINATPKKDILADLPKSDRYMMAASKILLHNQNVIIVVDWQNYKVFWDVGFNDTDNMS